jgi:hypothetical protein
VESHVQEACTALAAKIFAADPRLHTTGVQEGPEQVRLDERAVLARDGAFAGRSLLTL